MTTATVTTVTLSFDDVSGGLKATIGRAPGVTVAAAKPEAEALCAALGGAGWRSFPAMWIATRKVGGPEDVAAAVAALRSVRADAVIADERITECL